MRYPSDLTDEEWALIEPPLPAAKRGGNKRSVNLREVVNALLYVLSIGHQRRAIPKDLPPRSTVYDYFDLWDWDGALMRIHEALYVGCREKEGLDASPTAGVRGRISRCSDEPARAALYEAAHSLLTRSRKWSSLRAWDMKIAKRRGMARGRVTVACKLVVILHRMWADGTEFRFGKALVTMIEVAA